MCETSKLPNKSLRVPNRHSSSAPNRNIHRETTPNLRSAEHDRVQRKLVPAWEATALPFPFPRHGLRPGRSGFDVSLGVAAL